MTLDQRLVDAARHVAEQVEPPEVDLSAVRSRAHASRQRTAAIALTAAIAAAALVGRPLLVGRESTAPQPASSPTTGIIRTLEDTSCDTDGCLEPGSYSVDLGQTSSGQPLRTTLTVREGGWASNGFQHRVSRQSSTGSVALHVYQPQRLAGPQPCDAEGASTTIPPDATVDDVASLLASLEQLAVVDGPRPLEAFGRDARYLQVRADQLSCPAVEAARYQLVDIHGGDELDIQTGQPVLIQFWVVELEGKVILVEARQEGRPDKPTIQGLHQLRDSLTFEVGG